MSDNGTLFDTTLPPQEKKSSGPPNRMNDLRYGDWMKFQKSFFRFSDWSSLAKETATFFTKERWPDGSASSVLLCGFPHVASDLGQRRVTEVDAEPCHQPLHSLLKAGSKFDFIFANLSNLTAKEYAHELPAVRSLFEAIRELLHDGRYAGVVVDYRNEEHFPVPWAVALLGRHNLKLRDERIGLVSGKPEFCRYCLFFERADAELERAAEWLPSQVQVTAAKEIPHWIFPKSPPRKPDEILHPAKFPEKLVSEFIEQFTKAGDTVLDPMIGTGSVGIASVRSGRHALGIELNPEFAAIAERRLSAEHPVLIGEQPQAKVLNADARAVADLVRPSTVDYCITSPPYWSMLTNEGSENQKLRRERNLPTVYSDTEADVGNISSYAAFLDVLEDIYMSVAKVLKKDAWFTVVVKNVKRDHVIHPLGWDLVRILAGKRRPFAFAGTTLWCQDDISLKPFAVGIYWVSNTLHTYCLHFQRK